MDWRLWRSRFKPRPCTFANTNKKDGARKGAVFSQITTNCGLFYYPLCPSHGCLAITFSFNSQPMPGLRGSCRNPSLITGTSVTISSFQGAPSTSMPMILTLGTEAHNWAVIESRKVTDGVVWGDRDFVDVRQRGDLAASVNPQPPTSTIAISIERFIRNGLKCPAGA